ncbi:hypothetical protein GX563_04520 [Candidatus Bathyarchaeota archaeon]|nr:hypothetical protein [Candidatus Bathyarchaeota archaeon]
MVDKRRVKPSSKHSVQRFKASVEHKPGRRRKRFIGNSEAGVLPNPLPKRALKILSVLGADGVAEQAMVAAECVKSNVSYWAKRFVSAGALILRQTQMPNSTGPIGKAPEYKPGHPHYYDLTPYGSKLLTLGDGRLYFPILFEDRPLIFKVKMRESVPIPWKKLGDVRHWRKSGILLAGVRVELHDKLGVNHDEANVEIHPGHIKGFNVDELMMDSVRIVERVKFILESNYGLVLDEKGELPKSKTESGGPRWRVYVPAAREWVLHGSVDVAGVGAVDASPEPSKGGVRDPLSNVPHVEFNNRGDAALMASLYGSAGLTYDPAKQNSIDAVFAPAILRATHLKVSELVQKVSVLTAEVGLVKANQAQVGGVMGELHRLADSLAKLENLDKLPAITDGLQRVVDFLSKVQDTEVGKGQESLSGGRGYVS